MWIPTKGQWVVLWVGLAAVSAAAANAFRYDLQGWAGVIFLVGATVLLVWMIEAHRRKG